MYRTNPFNRSLSLGFRGRNLEYGFSLLLVGSASDPQCQSVAESRVPDEANCYLVAEMLLRAGSAVGAAT